MKVLVYRAVWEQESGNGIIVARVLLEIPDHSDTQPQTRSFRRSNLRRTMSGELAAEFEFAFFLDIGHVYFLPGNGFAYISLHFRGFIGSFTWTNKCQRIFGAKPIRPLLWNTLTTRPTGLIRSQTPAEAY